MVGTDVFEAFVRELLWCAGAGAIADDWDKSAISKGVYAIVSGGKWKKVRFLLVLSVCVLR